MRLLFMDFTLPHLLRDGDYPVGGWAVELNAWLHGLVEAGHDAGVLTWRGADAYVGRSAPFELIETYDPAKGIKILKYAYAYIPALIRAARQFRPDVMIQACASIHTGMMAVTAQTLGVPFVYRAVNDTDVEGRYKARIPFIAQKSYEYGIGRADAVICQNAYQRDQFRRWRPNVSRPILYNPFLRTSPAFPLQPRSNRDYVAWLGVFQPQKNLPLLLRIAQAAPDIRFRVGGMPSATDMDQPTLDALAALRRLANVEFAGYVKRGALAEFLSGAITLLSTSHYEGFSNTFLEAFAAGAPVVAPRRVDPDQIITRNHLGFTSESDDELVNLLRRVCDLSEDAHAALSARTRAYVQAEHAPAEQARKLVAALEGVINAGRA